MFFNNSSKAFFLSFFITFLTLPLLWILFNVVIDPYWFFKFVEIKGLNALKPQVTHEIRLAKAHHIYRIQPSNIILGSSRVELGIDPTYAAWKNFPGYTYNMALSGVGIEELYKTMQHSYFASKNLKLVVIGLDFFMFNAHRENVVFSTEVINFDEGRLLLSSSDFYLNKLFHDCDFFLGGKATLASWKTLQQNLTDLSQHDIYFYNGLRDPLYNPLRIMTEANASRLIFSQQERSYLNQIWRAGPQKRYCFSFNNINTLKTFRDIVDFAYNKGIDVRFFINPEHARMLLAVKEGGLWVQFEDWKRGMVKVLNEEAKRYQKKPFPLWDFSGFNSVTTEPIPVEGDKTTKMAWYWEGSHYKMQTGEAILNKVLNYPTPLDVNVKDFGILLNPDIVENHLKTIRDKMTLYENNFPKEVQFIKTVVKEVLKDSNGSNCGHDFEQLIVGSEALQKGDLKTANLAFDHALEIHLQEKKRAEEIGVPFREDQFMAHLEKVQNGQLIERTPLDWIGYQTRANEKKAKGDLGGAVSDYTKAIEKVNTPNTALYYLRGITYVELKDHKRAIQDFKIGLELEPNNKTLAVLLKQSEEALKAPSDQQQSPN